MLLCARCNKVLEGSAAASISGNIMGDEYIESWYLCTARGVYTKEVYRDRFSGESSVLTSRSVEKASGDVQVALIRNCLSPWDKNCRCSSHLRYFGGLS